MKTTIWRGVTPRSLLAFEVKDAGVGAGIEGEDDAFFLPLFFVVFLPFLFLFSPTKKN